MEFWTVKDKDQHLQGPVLLVTVMASVAITESKVKAMLIWKFHQKTLIKLEAKHFLERAIVNWGI